jgi:DNA primase
MIINKNLIEDLLKQTEITQVVSGYIPLTKKGKNHVGLCPFHQDKNPSLSVSQDKQIFKCFVCGTGGSALQFVQQFEKISLPQAIKKLSDLVGFQDPRLESSSEALKEEGKLKPYYSCLTDLLSFYHFSLASEEGQIAREYLLKRGIDEATMEAFGIGFSVKNGQSTIQYLLKRGHTRSTIETLGIPASARPDFDRLAGRVIFPIFNPEGQVVGFSGRLLDAEPNQAKYVNSSDSLVFNKRDILYNYHRIKLASKKANHVYVMEGFMDVIALHRANIPQAVAIMGTAFTDHHAMLLKQLNVEVRIALDNDQAGQDAMIKMLPMLNEKKLIYSFVQSTGDGKDSDEILEEHGAEGLKAYLDNVLNKIDFSLHYYQKKLDLTSTEHKVTLIKALLPFIAGTPSLEQIDYLKKVGHLTGYPLATLQELVAKYSGHDKQTDYFAMFKPEAKVLPKLQRAEKAILYNMLINPEAVNFYQEKVHLFYTDLYRKIAEFLLDYQKDRAPTMQDLINDIAVNASDQSQALIDTITNLATSQEFPIATLDQLDDYLKTIQSEKVRMATRQKILSGIAGKDESDAARLILQILGKHLETPEQEGGDKDETNDDEDTAH